MENDKVKWGEVQVALVKDSVVKSFELLDKMGASDFEKAAKHHGLPTEPFDKRLLRPVLMGFLQEEWYRKYEGGVPTLCSDNQKKRVTRYKQQLEEIKANVDGKDLVVSRKKASSGSAPRQANLYRLTEAAKETWSKFKGQKFVVVKTMQALGGEVGGKGCTVRQVFEHQKPYDGIEPPSDKNCAFHMNKFVHEAVVEQVGDDGKAVPRKEKEEKPAEKPAAKKEEPKAKGKK